MMRLTTDAGMDTSPIAVQPSRTTTQMNRIGHSPLNRITKGPYALLSLTAMKPGPLHPDMVNAEGLGASLGAGLGLGLA